MITIILSSLSAVDLKELPSMTALRITSAVLARTQDYTHARPVFYLHPSPMLMELRET